MVSISPDTEAAFWMANRTTLVGSITPAAIRFSYFSVSALKPKSTPDTSPAEASTVTIDCVHSVTLSESRSVPCIMPSLST